MDSTTEKLINKVFDLSPQMRAFIAEKLIESLDKEHGFEISEEWDSEIKRRCKEIDEGRATLIDAEKVFAKAFEELL